MTEFHFQKWQATGNDFVIVDNRDRQINNYSPHIVKKICDRKFGVGADGFMILKTSRDYDFEMKYFNADGFEAEMCGNGGRSIVGFARGLGIISDITHFEAIDGLHDGVVLGNNTYRIRMVDVEGIEENEYGYFLNTGVPHLVIFTDHLEDFDVHNEGRQLRHHGLFAPQGTNVNYVQIIDGVVHVRTYERGVENETLSCGTGTVASCIVASMKYHLANHLIAKVRGGSLRVSFNRSTDDYYSDIFLEGEAMKVFEGHIKI